ncbi:hypothetical protein A3A74_05505 [Candidatus Roizmanbacteria bacterium RIFCSPLOWO2_01_FULL_35_13]|uniref:Glycosyltransferase RgtA/B/C/D-like domain-containing protein n=1 Tax=Candidatus Roizmanbacteria bacterium RIFCSPLOWO2_01_FULL_35_13 TaxID=1802055 RepID=A0A1F7I968_9BACT|nr:MAG: hypothetical protein A3A74_05505 [Candidatus Roizmanbacteria bacterium RIFCSPLOWO2_01_FULL_35_13]
MKEKFNYFLTNNKLVFLFFIVLVFLFYRTLFQSYFEADEWYAFTLNLPLTHDPWGFLKVLIKYSTIDAPSLAQLQHIVPLAEEIFFLNALFFGTNFVPYAFISLSLHALNSFLVFMLIKLLISRRPIFAFLGGLFFALSPVQMHAVTWAATYQTSVLPVTLSLLSIIFFMLAYLRNKKKFIYISVLFLFLALSTKETSIILFIILPIIAFFEKRTFPSSFLVKIFVASLIVYLVFRFLLPGIYSLSSLKTQQAKVSDTHTVVSRDLSIYTNLPREVLFRAITFPVRMIGTSFLPRQTVFSIVQFITPIVSPVDPGGNTIGQLAFLYGSGNFVIIYLVSLAVIFFCLSSIIRFIKRKQISEAKPIVVGLAIIILSAFPLVAIIFSFPRWGYDFYFDSRYYYGPSIGAAIIFPFLIFGIGEFVSKNFYIRKTSTVVLIAFIFWLINNIYVFNLGLKEFTQNYRPDARVVVRQLKEYLPKLPPKTVFYFETDGKSALGPRLPFFTSVPQALTVVYYDVSPLPDSFFDKPLFLGNPEGYQYADGRGFGFYTSKKELAEDLSSGLFSGENIHSFYYYAEKVKLKNTTWEIRGEMENFLKTEK